MVNFSPLWISLKVSLCATFIAFVFGVSFAYGLYNYRGKGRSLLEGILLIPLVLPPTVVGFILLILLGKNGILAPWNLNFVFNWYGAVIATTIMGFPLMFRISLGAFEQIDSLILDAARIEGASEMIVFIYIAIPMGLRGIISGLVLTFTRIMGEFGATLMVAGNIPNKTQTIPMAIYFAVQGGNINEAWFWCIVLLLISFLSIFLINLSSIFKVN
ncbi:molybdate ABC transporter permease subunit [Cyanobacterium stanieri LEGE 03274]|uniref:Molybdenum transport system permease n=1 Tax=Cyanobacterium stanieri LEGE 03274 TaxID=1828756 RepID=A0ABR9V2D8_9CHRO|nr:molybdate ABC transporter permease subunit [Cyanobacterium stanieri]MBE9222059.1 molybdate ABC transporter permease subunit [Cyanobacterium stanieri LEGE 03274]